MEQFDNMNENSSKNEVSAGGSLLYLVIGWISAILSLITYPFIFGIVGIIMGVLSTKNQSRGGLPLIIGTLLLMSIGLMSTAAYTFKLTIPIKSL